MNESMKIDLRKALLELHGDKLYRILEITENTFRNINSDNFEHDNNYIQ
jgi:hypothetical protein